jgi:hypothetical protein
MGTFQKQINHLDTSTPQLSVETFVDDNLLLSSLVRDLFAVRQNKQHIQHMKNIIIAILVAASTAVATFGQAAVQDGSYITVDGKLQQVKVVNGQVTLIPVTIVAAAPAAPAPAPAAVVAPAPAPAAPAPAAPAPQQNGLLNGVLNAGNSFVGGGLGNAVEAKLEGRNVSFGKAFVAGGAGNAAKNVAGDALNLFGFGNGGNILNGNKPAGR